MEPTAKQGTSAAQAPAIQRVVVIGAGQMGNGIAHVCALSGYDVFLMDANKDALKKGVDTITYNLGRQVARNFITEADSKAALKRISSGTTYAFTAHMASVSKAIGIDWTPGMDKSVRWLSFQPVSWRYRSRNTWKVFPISPILVLSLCMAGTTHKISLQRKRHYKREPM